MPPVGLRYKDVSSVQQRIFVPFDPSKGNNNAQIAVFIIDRVFDATNTLQSYLGCIRIAPSKRITSPFK